MRWMAPPSAANRLPNATYRSNSGAAATTGTQGTRNTSWPISSAHPMLPVSLELSNVEQTLYCTTGAPISRKRSNTGGSASRIHSGERLRLSPAIPTARQPPNSRRSSASGGRRKSTAGTPFAASASRASVEPVKSSP